MNLRSVDLNLLVVLQALLEERHVSRARLRAGLSQPAMSNALARLRTMFGDALLVRTPAGMELTDRARELAGSVGWCCARRNACSLRTPLLITD